MATGTIPATYGRFINAPPSGVGSSSTAAQVVAAAETGVFYSWSLAAAQTYTPVNKSGDWVYTLHNALTSSNKNYVFFEAYSIDDGEIYRFSNYYNKWFKQVMGSEYTDVTSYVSGTATGLTIDILYVESGVVYVRMSTKPGQNWTNLATGIPTAYLPRTNVCVSCRPSSQNDASKVCYGLLQTGGTLSLLASAAFGAGAEFTATWPLKTS